VDGLWKMFLGYLANLLMVYVVAQVVWALAPTFEGRKDPLQALKLVVHAWTPVWLAGVATILPHWIGLPIALAGLAYAVYLFYLGLPHTMHNPHERSLGFAATSAVLTVLLTWILAALLAAVSIRGPAPGAVSGSRHARQAATSGADRQPSAGHGQTLAPARMRALLPAQLHGFRRVSAQARRQEVMGLQLSQATATYRGKGQQQIELQITDTAGAKALLGLSGGSSGDSETVTDHGFDTLQHQGDRILHASWNSNDQRGEYTVLLAHRFSVRASGHVKDAAALKQAVHAVDLDTLDALGHAGDGP
jgi:hypothetical protein